MVTFAQLPKYEAYKDSGVEWLSEIPLDWAVIKMKFLFKDTSIKNMPNEALLSVTQDKGVVPRSWVENRMVMPSGNLESFKYIEKGDFAISLRSFEGGLEYCHHAGIISPAYTVLKTTKTNLVDIYYKYLFKSKVFISELQTSVVGIREGKNISYDELRYSFLPIPSKFEQVLIANFLDQKTAQIDAAIAIKEQQVELLKERKQIIIQQAVTQGLDPNVPMKDSGVEWIGQIPEHWEIVPLKHLCKFSGGGTPSKDNLSFWKDGTIPWVSPKDMKSSYISKTQDYITEKAVKNSSTNYVKPNSLLLVVRSGILQRKIPVAINTVQVTLNQDMKSLTFNNRITVNFMMSYILGNNDALLFEWIKEGATVESVEHEYLACSLITVPPIEEQRRIENHVLKISQETDDAVSLQQQQIQKLKEYKTTLINSAVTGKIKITPEMLQA